MGTDNSTTEKKNILTSLNVKNKFHLTLVIIALVSIAIIGNVLFWQNKSNVIQGVFDKLNTVNNLKKAQTEHFFSGFKNDIILLSDDQTVKEAARDLKSAFRLVGSDQQINLTDNVLQNARLNLTNFYNSDFIPKLNQQSLQEYAAEDFLPKAPAAIYLQHLFLAENPNEYQNKKLFDKPVNGGEYASLHFLHHTYLRSLAEKFGFADLMLVDTETGHVFYSVAKNIDFGTSLLSGPLHNTPIAQVFRTANSSNMKNHVSFSDLNYYSPALNKSIMFLGSPVFVDGEKSAVLIAKIEQATIENMLTANRNYEAMRLGSTGDIFIVSGKNNTFRTNPRPLIEHRNEFLKDLQEENTDQFTLQKISVLNNACNLVESNIATESYKIGVDDPDDFNKYIHADISMIQPLDINGLEWRLVSKISRKEALQPIRSDTWLFLGIAIVILVLIFLGGRVFAEMLVKRINTIKDALLTMSHGERIETIKTNNKDELDKALAAINTLNARISEASEFSLKIGNGNFEDEFIPVSENDQLGVSLKQMKESLIEQRKEEEKRALEEKRRNWITQGIAKFSDFLRQNNNDIDKLTFNLVSQLVDYLNAKLAGIYLMSEEDEEEKYLELSATYAYDRHKYNTKKIQLGEGLVGACALEKKTILLKEIPDNYIHVTSGFGEAKPKTLLIVPMQVDDKVMGVIEIGSFNDFEPHEIEFVENIAETIGSTMVTARINERTARLLEDSRMKSEEMAAQEEEMRQNMEELQATQDEMRRVQDKMGKEHKALEEEKMLMDSLLNHAKEHIYFKNRESKFIRFSKSMLDLFKLKDESELLGKSDFDFFTEEHARPAYEDEQRIIKTGKPILDVIEKETHADGTVSYVLTSKMPLKDKEGNIYGTFGISKDITDSKKIEDELNNLSKLIQEKDKEIQELSKKLKKAQTESGSDEALLKRIEDCEAENNALKKNVDRLETTRDKLNALIKKNKKK